MSLGGSGVGRFAQPALGLALLLALWLGAPGRAGAATAPQIPASWVTGVFSTGATLRAEINAEGEATTYHFEYISEAAYQANLQAAREGFFGASRVPKSTEAGIGHETTPLTVFQSASGLTPATTYRYRPLATNPGGTTVGPEHALITTGTGGISGLPDGRAWELVSPVDKGGSAIQRPESIFGGGDFQAADSAAAITYSSATAFDQPQGAPPGSQYISRRTASGWVTENISTPLKSGAYGPEPDGVPYRVFSQGLSRALLFGGLACREGPAGCPTENPVLPGAGAPAGYMAYYLRNDEAGTFASLLSASDLANTAVSKEDFEVDFAGATPDLSHVVLSSCAKLTADAKEVLAPGGCAGQNLYEWSGGGALKAINLLPGDTETTPGAFLAAPIGAISDDGNRVYMYQLEDGPLYLREGTQSKAIAGTIGEPAAFQAASGSGRYAFYTKAGHLYRWDSEDETSTDLTPAGGVQGVLGVSADGAYAYYQDGTGLQQWHIGEAEAETTTTVAAGANAALPSDYPPATGTSRVSTDGKHLAFISEAELDTHDNLDADTHEPDTEVYLYGPPASGGPSQLICVSCNPKGERPSGSSSIPGAVANGSTFTYKTRVLSSDGQRVFFDSEDNLVTGDNSGADVYEWEALEEGDCNLSSGCIDLISKGGGSFLDASANGEDVYFVTGVSLVNDDPGSIDVYDAKVGGGFPEGPGHVECLGDACQVLPSEPEDPTPGTLVPSTGNQKVRYLTEKRRKGHRHHREHRHHRHHRRYKGGRRR